MGRSLVGAVLSTPQWPAAKDPYTWASAAASILSSGQNLSPTLPSTLNDGSYIVLNASAFTITLFNAAGTAIWTKTAANFNASAVNISQAVWIDTVDGALYGVAGNSGGTIAYPFKIAISTGVVTPLGAGFSVPTNFLNLGSQPTYGYLSRAAQGSGDFTLFGSGGGSVPPRQLSFSSSTGAITFAIANTVSGSTPIGTSLSSAPLISYRSLDGTILMGFTLPYSGNMGASPIGLALYRNGKAALFSPQNFAGYTSSSGSNSVNSSVAVVGNSVMIITGNIVQGQFPIMLRSDFDAFLAAACTYIGI